jgi:hypothetical protein
MPFTENPQGNATFSPSSANQQPVMPSNKYEIEDWKWLVERDLQNELGVPPRWETPENKIEFHRRQLALLLDKANDAPRCAHVFADGRTCKAPRVKRGTLCYAHAQMEARSPKQMNLPPLEDANAVAIWIMEVSRSLLDGRISEKTAGLMFYGLQLAMVNAKQTTFKDTNPLEMVRTPPAVCRELKARKKAGARIVTEVEVEEEFVEEALPEKSETPEEEGNPGVESCKSIFSGVEVDGGRGMEEGPSASSLDDARDFPPEAAQLQQASEALDPAETTDSISTLAGTEEMGIPCKPASKPGMMLVHSGG